MATKFTYKMRSGGKWDVGSGTPPTQTNKKKYFIFAMSTEHTHEVLKRVLYKHKNLKVMQSINIRNLPLP